MIFFLLFLTSGVTAKDGRVYPTPDVDVTQGLIGRTIYLEYDVAGFIGYWIGHNETYNGTLYSIREEHLFDPQERVRVQVEDCGNGYACLRSRWQEYEDSSRWYMSDLHDTIHFREEENQALNDYMKWRVYCTNEEKLTFCYICDYYFSWLYESDNCIYGLSDYSLTTTFPSLYEFPDAMFVFKIKVPKAEDQGYVEAGQTICNSEDSESSLDLEYSVGVSIKVASPWEYTQSSRSELRSGFEMDLLGTDWEYELENPELFSSNQTLSTIVPTLPGHKTVAYQLLGYYGPYRVRGSTLRLVPLPC